MNALARALFSVGFLLATTIVAVAQDSPEARAHIAAAGKVAGTEWPFAAKFFCSTEDEVTAMKILPSATSEDVEGQRAEPMKVFDNLYFVGQKAVTTWAITTSDGIILIDSGYPERFDDTLVAGLKKVGLDPSKVKLAIIAHEHADHFGGAPLIQEKLGARIVMSQAAWDSFEPKPGAQPATRQPGAPKRELVMAEGQPITLGDTKVMPVSIPGHTAGSMGFVFPVKDQGKTYMAALFGGSILNPQKRFPASLFRQYLTSLEHFSDVTKKMKVEVELMNHPIMDGLFEKLAKLKSRKPGEPHPLVVGEASYQRFLGVMTECARAQLARHQVS
jgi:metallo-beta-lactamase class B